MAGIPARAGFAGRTRAARGASGNCRHCRKRERDAGLKPGQRVCVYCGSNAGERPIYATAARTLADALCERGLGLVYGGAAKGLMGVIADRVLELGGTVHGVIPKFLQDKEIAHVALTELHVVSSMHERKTLMAELANGFIALPGGLGTLEELVEIVTWGQLRMHNKPCGVYNVEGYFDALLKYLDHASAEGFLRPENRRMLLADTSANGLLDQFATYVAPNIEKWTD